MLAEPHALNCLSLALSTCTGNTGNHDAIDGPRPSDELKPGYRTAPHNIEAEQSLLGAILVNNEAL